MTVEMFVKDLKVMMIQSYDKVMGMISGTYHLGEELVQEMSLFQGIRKDGLVVAKLVSFLWGQKGNTFIMGVVNKNDMDSQLAGIIFTNTKSVIRFQVYAKSSDIGLGKCSVRCTRCNEKVNGDNRCVGCKHSGDYLTVKGFCLDCHRESESYDQSCRDVIGDIRFTEAPGRYPSPIRTPGKLFYKERTLFFNILPTGVSSAVKKQLFTSGKGLESKITVEVSCATPDANSGQPIVLEPKKAYFHWMRWTDWSNCLSLKVYFKKGHCSD